MGTDGDPAVTRKPPWWRRKRWWAVGVLWLGLTYGLSFGPAKYAAHRGWVRHEMVDALYIPATTLLPRYTGPWRYGPEGFGKRVKYRDHNPRTEKYYRYVDWWANLGFAHAHYGRE